MFLKFWFKKTNIKKSYKLTFFESSSVHHIDLNDISSQIQCLIGSYNGGLAYKHATIVIYIPLVPIKYVLQNTYNQVGLATDFVWWAIIVKAPEVAAKTTCPIQNLSNPSSRQWNAINEKIFSFDIIHFVSFPNKTTFQKKEKLIP